MTKHLRPLRLCRETLTPLDPFPFAARVAAQSVDLCSYGVPRCLSLGSVEIACSKTCTHEP